MSFDPIFSISKQKELKLIEKNDQFLAKSLVGLKYTIRLQHFMLNSVDEILSCSELGIKSTCDV